MPCLRLDDGTVLNENLSVLCKLADMKPEAGLMPKDETGRLLEQQALSFVASELHASLRYFFSLPADAAPAGSRTIPTARVACASSSRWTMSEPPPTP